MYMYVVCMYVCVYACVCIEGGGGGCTGGKLGLREIPLSVCHSYLHVHGLHDGCAANNMQAADQATIKERNKKEKMHSGGAGHAVVYSVCG